MKKTINKLVTVLILLFWICTSLLACSSKTVSYTREELCFELLKVDFVERITTQAPYSQTVRIIKTLDEEQKNYALDQIGDRDFCRLAYYGPPYENGYALVFYYSSYTLTFAQEAIYKKSLIPNDSNNMEEKGFIPIDGNELSRLFEYIIDGEL